MSRPRDSAAAPAASSSTVEAFVALGSNLGDRWSHLQSALDALGEAPGVRLVDVSRIYETAPVGPAGQGPYLNAVALLETALAPRALLDLLQELEAVAGRSREGEPRWGPRVLDLDLLFYGDRLVDEAGLTVPHPRLAERPFVLEPLAELAADRVHPVLGETVGTLAERVRDAEAVWLWRRGGSEA